MSAIATHVLEQGDANNMCVPSLLRLAQVQLSPPFAFRGRCKYAHGPVEVQ